MTTTIIKDPKLGTPLLVEEYEFQAHAYVGGACAGVIEATAAANFLYRIRVDMHDRIHELTQTDECEFCFSERIPVVDNITNRPHYKQEKRVELSIGARKWMCPTCWKWILFSETKTRSTLAVANNSTTVHCPKEHLLASWMDDCTLECCAK
jgi:hypothetical protein